MALSQIRATTLLLRSIESHNIENDHVRVKAGNVAADRTDTKLERIVGRLSLDPNVVAASWRVAAISDDEGDLVATPEA